MSQLKENNPQSNHNPTPEPGDFSTPYIVAPSAGKSWATGFYVLFAVCVLLLGVILGLLVSGQMSPSLATVLSDASPQSVAVSANTSTPVPVATLTSAAPTSMATPTPDGFLPTPPIAGGGAAPLRVPTPPPGGVTLTLTPSPDAVGWVSSLSGHSHFNDPNIHVGFFNDHVYYGAIQFDLSAVPPASRITYAALELVGLSDQNLGKTGSWQVEMLNPTIDPAWTTLTFDQFQTTEPEIGILPLLNAASLQKDRPSQFPFGPEQLAFLQQHVAQGAVSFRIRGPEVGPDNLFTWDSGSSQIGQPPKLWLVTDRTEYVVITPTPTPENVLTLAAVAATSTAASTTSTPTPLPPAWATPIVVTAVPPPANNATATYQAQVATAEAMAYGTATPTPLNVWTATPTPNYVLVTATATPENVVTAAAEAALATYVAQTVGTYTPVPANWITPVVIDVTPIPRNEATAEFQRMLATSEAFLNGTPVAIWTATATPVFVEFTPAPTFTPTPGYQPIVEELIGKIAFISDRAGSEAETGLEPRIYVMDPDGSNINQVTNRAAYNTALAQDNFSADQRYRTFVREFLRFDGERVPGIYLYDYLYNAEEQLTQFGSGLAWDPVWSPTREQIAFVSNESGDDEIWVINRDGSGLMQLTETNQAYNAREIGKDTFIPEINRHPSWSPDGSQLIFWSNRTGNAQIWIMNADGSNQRIINPGPFNDWNPVWIKYTNLPPLLPEPPKPSKNPYDKFN